MMALGCEFGKLFSGKRMVAVYAKAVHTFPPGTNEGG